jgi:hypothetical protein
MRPTAASVAQPVKGVMLRRCMWCMRVIGARMAPGMVGETGGICRKCKRKLDAEIAKACAGKE